MFNFLDLLVVVLATGAIIEVWHKGSIFQTIRAYLQALQDVTPLETFKGRLLELLNCPFCKSYHIPLLLFLTLLAGDSLGSRLAWLPRVVIYAWAATRLSNIVDGLLPGRMRYDPTPEKESLP
jgi:hypothetical protein